MIDDVIELLKMAPNVAKIPHILVANLLAASPKIVHSWPQPTAKHVVA